MGKTKKTTTDFAQFIRNKLAKNPALADAVDEARVAADIAEEIFQARKEAGLTQAQLAERIGSTQSVIARLEDSDYRGHSVAMLRKIAAVTGKQLGVAFYAAPQVFNEHSNNNFTPEWGSICKWNLKIEAQVTQAQVATTET